MVFRFYTNQVSEHFAKATRGFAAGAFIVGMLLIGFGMLIFALPKLFAYLAAAVFFVAGLSCTGYAVKLFWAASRMNRQTPEGDTAYRENVQVHIEEHYE